MDASLRSKAEELASEIASQAKTAEDLQGLMGLMMKSALERMLDTEMDVHLGRRMVGGEEREQLSGATDGVRRSRRSVLRTVATAARRKQSKGIWAN